MADTSLLDDLGRKRLLYASAGAPTYWVVDVNGRALHRFTQPRDGDYRRHETLTPPATVEVPGAVDGAASLALAAFFPPV